MATRKSLKRVVPSLTGFLTILLACSMILLIFSLLFPKNSHAPETATFKFNHSYNKASLQKPIHSGNQVRIPILIYHYIGNNPNPKDLARDNLSVSPDKFEAQMEYLSEGGFNTLTLDKMYQALKTGSTLPPKSVILTFDDGYIDFYFNAYPILKKYGLSATVFIPTALMNQGYYLSWDQIREMDSSGLISFQSHSVSHADLPSLDHDQLFFQLRESKKTLEQVLGKPVDFLAYPYGTSNSDVWQATKEVGYLAALGTWYSDTLSEGVIYDLPRIKIAGEYSLSDFVSRI